MIVIPSLSQTHLSSSMYSNELGHQREALVQRLSEFNNTNRRLRTLLRDQQAKEVGDISVWPYMTVMLV